MASVTGRALSRKIVGAALTLLEWAEGNTELARAIWNEAFEEAERIDHNQSLGEPDELDRVIIEQARRFDQVAAVRQKFHVVKDDNGDKDD